jgi:hypothetical protein
MYFLLLNLSSVCSAPRFGVLPKKTPTNIENNHAPHMPTAANQIHQTSRTKEHLEMLLNVATVAYAAFHIYKRYKVLNKPAPIIRRSFVGSLLNNVYTHMFPPTIQKSFMQGNFCLEALGIVIEALLYKTVAQLIIICGSGSIMDVVEMGVVRGKKIVHAALL